MDIREGCNISNTLAKQEKVEPALYFRAASSQGVPTSFRVKALHISTRSSFSENSFMIIRHFWCVLGRPPDISFSRSSTRLKSPPMILSHLKSSRCPEQSKKKADLSSFGA